MIGAKRLLLALVAMAGLIGSSGCCCCGCGGCREALFHRDRPDDYKGAGSYFCGCGCGELYCGDWHSTPPHDDPCDCCGNWVGGCEESMPAYQLPPRAHGGPGVPADLTPPPTPPHPEKTPVTSGRSRYNATPASYNAPVRCATCGE